MLDRLSCELAVERLLADGGYRVQRRLDVEARSQVANDNTGTKIGVVVDVETTGIDKDRDVIIELALRRFRFDDAGLITKLDRCYRWLEDPGVPLDPQISAMTGLTDADLAGQRIDDEAAAALLCSAHVRAAFNACFDRPFVERRLPSVAGNPWACVMREIDWRGRGFDGGGRALSFILMQCGFFNDRAHQANADVDATIAILEHRNQAGETALFELLETASQPTWRIAAVGAHFDVKDKLKRRGYRWDPAETVWWCEAAQTTFGEEKAWLAANVYAPEYRPRTDMPLIREVTWETRHG